MEILDEVQVSLDAVCDPAVEVVRGFGRAGWEMWSTLLDQYERAEAVVNDSEVPPLVRQAELSCIPYDLARRVHLSEGQVTHLVAKARRLRDRTPMVWKAFAEGRINVAKASEISGAIDRLKRAGSIERLDRQVIAYAEVHTDAETRRWLKVFVARVEADLFNERAERALADRGADVVHGDDGVSSMVITHASHVIAAVDKRITKEANAFGKDDPRTLQQRRADLFAAWMTTNEAREVAINADIAVTMTASALIGATDDPAVAADGSWVVPAAWIRELAKFDPSTDSGRNNIFWHRMLLDPVTDDVLAHEYQGRFAPEILAKALEFRDGVCQAHGCCRPAYVCDMDHRIPHDDGGPTAGWNMGPYCRRHHKLKGFGLIDVGPTTTSPPGRSRNTPLHSVGKPDFSWVESHLQQILWAA